MGAAMAVTTLTLCLGVALLAQQRSNRRLQAELNDAGRWAASNRDALARQAERNRQLEARIEAANRALAEATARLKAPTQPHDAPAPPRQAVVRDRKSALQELSAAGIPRPALLITTNAAGLETASLHFPELRDRAHRRLATNVRFSSLHGRRLVFRTVAGPPLAFDVDDLHPLILSSLGIDPDEAKQAQAELDRQKRLQAEAAERERRVRAEAERKWREATARAQAEQRKQDQARAQAEADQESKRLSATTDRLLALAALATAEAAYGRAVSPSYLVPYPVHTWHFTPFWTPWPSTYQLNFNRSFRFHQPFRFLPPSQYSPASSVLFTADRPASFP